MFRIGKIGRTALSAVSACLLMAAAPKTPATTPIETAIWSHVQRGEPLNLCDRKTPQDVCHHPPVSADFLVRILRDTAWSNQLPRQIVTIRGAAITGPLDFADLHLLKGLDLTDCTVAGGLNAAAARIDGPLILRGCQFAGDINMWEIAVDGDLALSQASHLAPNVQLGAAHIKGNFRLAQSTIAGTLDLTDTVVDNQIEMTGLTAAIVSANRLHVGGLAKLDVAQVRRLLLAGASFGWDVEFGDATIGDSAASQPNPSASGIEAENTIFKGGLKSLRLNADSFNLMGANIAGDIYLVRAKRLGSFNAADAQVGGNLHLGCLVTGETNLSGAHIGLNVYFGHPSDESDKADCPPNGSHAHFVGRVLARNAVLGGSLYLDSASFDAPVSVTSATIGHDLELDGAHLASLDLSDSTVHDTLHVSPESWPAKAFLLRGVKVGTFSVAGDPSAPQAPCDKRVPALDADFHGLTYQSLIGFDDRQSRLTGDTTWYDCPLQHDAHFAFQPYRQAAAVYRAIGDYDRANDIMRKANWRALNSYWAAGDWGQFAATAALGLLIGWGLGFGYFLALGWATFAVVCGAIWLLCARLYPAHEKRRLLWCLIASLTRFVPLVTLEKSIDDYLGKRLARARWRTRIYFVLHTAFGYLIVSTLAAALAGLTQAS